MNSVKQCADDNFETANVGALSATGADALLQDLRQAIDDRRRAECLCRVQANAMQIALDLLVREPDITGFFRAFMKVLVDECESEACTVWLLDDTTTSCDLWLAHVQGAFHEGSTGWGLMAGPRPAMAAHLLASTAGWTETVDYTGDDERLPPAVREFNRAAGVECVVVAPLVLSTGSLGWVALSSRRNSVCEVAWQRALVDAMAKQTTLALYQNRLAEQALVEARRQAMLEERNRIARDIHDTLTQGFAAILMQLQAARRSAHMLPPMVATTLDTAVDLARTHMLQARRSVGTLRPHADGDEDLGSALRRMTDLARRTTEVPITLVVDDLPGLNGTEREIIGIAQEALTNAVRHSRAKGIRVHASAVRSVGFRLTVADDGRGIAKDQGDGGFGMTSMQERAARIGASLTIVTAPRAGTEVVLAWEPPSFSIPGTDAVHA